MSDKKPTAITPAVEQLISEALAIEAESALTSGRYCDAFKAFFLDGTLLMVCLF